jgi:protein-S-isoprenylcysteine O-methyltransferase Ste14
MVVGAGLATANWIAAALITLVVSPIYAYRIRAEETMLQTRLGEQYKAYMARSWRLIPRLY